MSPPAVSEIRKTSDIDFTIPKNLSFFDPYLRYWINEALEIGGEAYVAKASDGAVSGLFTYDDFEKIGTIYTRSMNVFDYFYGLKPFNILFAEMRSEHENEIHDIYTIDLEKVSIDHRFRHEISVASEDHFDEIKQFMVLTDSGINRKWVNVAFKNGDRCIIVRLGNEISGLGWLSFVNGIGRMHSLYVKPQFRGMGMGEDILYARLLWLKSNHAKSAFSEIPRSNLPSSRVATKAHMTVSGQVFQYFRSRSNPEIAPRTATQHSS
jgi:ribosomal protein S18 acetylase RimI-like enzyme